MTIYEQVYIPVKSGIKSLKLKRGWYDLCRNEEIGFVQILTVNGWIYLPPEVIERLDKLPKCDSKFNTATDPDKCRIASCKSSRTKTTGMCQRHTELFTLAWSRDHFKVNKRKFDQKIWEKINE